MPTKLKISQVNPIPAFKDTPALTGTPTAPTPATSDNSTQIATTAYVKSNLSSYLPLSGGTSNLITGDLYSGKTTDWFRIQGGSSNNSGARLALGAATLSGSNAGTFYLTAATSSSDTNQLIGTPSGSLTWSGATPSMGTNNNQLATTAYVYQNAARVLTANTTIYVSTTAAGTGDGSSVANAMNTDTMWKYLSGVHCAPTSGGKDGSITLTICFVPGSYGNISFDGSKMPGVRNLVINTSTGTNSTLENYSTNSPIFGIFYVRCSNLNVTLKNIHCTSGIYVEYGANVSMNTYVGAATYRAQYYGFLTFGNGIYNVPYYNGTNNYLIYAGTRGMVILDTATMNFNFADQCYFNTSIFYATTYGRVYLNSNRIKYTGVQPIVATSASGTLTGTSSTAAGTAAKDVTLADGQTFTLANNAVAYVKFTNNNTAENPTLNINSTGAKPVYYNGSPIPAKYLNNIAQYKVTYDSANDRYNCNNTFQLAAYAAYCGIFQTSGNITTTYNSSDWNWTGFSTSYVNGANVNGTIYGAFNGTSVTQSASDNSTKIATTAYVKSNLSNYLDLTSDQTVTSCSKTIYGGDKGWWVSNDTYRTALLMGSGGINRGLWDSALNKWMVYANATTVILNGDCTGNAATATKLGTATKGSSIQPIYLNAGAPTACTLPTSGAWFSSVPQINSSGVMEIGRYLDFHATNASTNDFDGRFQYDGTVFQASKGITAGGNVVGKNYCHAMNTTLVKGTNPSSVQYAGMYMCDKNGTAYGGNALGLIETSVSTAGVVSTYMRALKNEASSTTNCQITCSIDASGNVYTSAPTPASTDSSTKIATTAFVKANVPASKGSDTQPVYTNSNGVITACTNKNLMSALCNALDTATSNPADADYYICQYANGGTTTTTYYRRPVSKLYNYMKGKFDSVYSASGHTHSYLPLAGGTMTGVIKKATTSDTYVNGTNNAALNLTNTSGFNSAISGFTKSNKWAVSSYPGSTELVYLHSVTKTNATNNTNTTLKSLSWNTSDGTLTADKVVGAYYADYAEWFPRGEETEPGDVIVLDLDSDEEKYIRSNKDNKIVVGVHSDNYHHIIGGDAIPLGENTTDSEYNMPKYIPVALAGRIKTKFIGKAKKGSYVVASEVTGVARAYDRTIDNPEDIFGILVESDNLDQNIRRLQIKLK